jgi:hypothetical protein
LTLRYGSGYFSKFVVEAYRDHKVRHSTTLFQNPGVERVIEKITEDVCTPIY